MNRIKKHKIWSTVIAILVLIIIAGFFGDNKTKDTKPNPRVATPTPPPVAQTTSSNPNVSIVFDVPALLGKDIDQVRAVLGTSKNGDLAEPNTQQKQLGVDQWDNTFEKNGRSLLVTFNPNTRKVVDYFIDSKDSSSSTSNKNYLLGIGNLNEHASNYTIEFVKVINDTNKITGVKITPK